MNQELETTYSKLLDLSMLINSSDIDINKIESHLKNICETLELLFRQFGCDSLNDYLYVKENTDLNTKCLGLDANMIKLILENFHVVKITHHKWDKNFDNDAPKELNKLSLITENDMIYNSKI